MKQNDGWMNALTAMILILVPVLVGFYLWLPDWTNRWVITYGQMWWIAIAFFIYVATFSFVLIYFKLLSVDSLALNIPITIVMISIFLTPGLSILLRGLIVMILILTAVPSNMLVTKIKAEIKYRNRKNAN